MATKKETSKKPATKEIGVSGISVSMGQVSEEYQRELTADRGRRVYREMMTGDDTVGAAIKAMTNPLKGVDWKVEASEADKSGEHAEFVNDALFEDMALSWSDTMDDVLTFLPYGWAFLEIVWKLRMGLDQRDASRRSKFNDGKVGVRKLALRKQTTLKEWHFDEDGGLSGMTQTDPNSYNEYYIPIEKALLFKTVNDGGNPEGISVLRTAYKKYYEKKNIEMYEDIGLERNLAGIPVVKLPKEVIDEGGTRLNSYKKIVRDLKRNSQSGIIHPSDTYTDKEGNITQIPLVTVELLSSSGGGGIDVDTIIKRKDNGIARSLLAQFLMISGSGSGSFALSRNETDLFLDCLTSYLNKIEDTLNRHLLPRLWMLNAFDPELMPKLKAGQVKPKDIKEFGQFLRDATGAGFRLDGDEETELYVRETGGLPASPENLPPEELENPDVPPLPTRDQMNGDGKDEKKPPKGGKDDVPDDNPAVNTGQKPKKPKK